MIEYILGAGQHTLRLLGRRTRLSTFPEPSCWLSCTEGGPGVVGCVIESLVLGHVLVHILGLDLKEKAVCVRVEELAALSVLRFELVVMEFVHLVLGEIQNAQSHIHRRLSTRVLLWTWIAARSSSKILARANAVLAIRRLSLSSSCERTSFTSTRFRRLSMVFPKTELFINLCRSFSKSLAAFFRSSVFIRMYGSIQGLWSNQRERWTLVRRMLRYVYSCRFR